MRPDTSRARGGRRGRWAAALLVLAACGGAPPAPDAPDGGGTLAVAGPGPEDSGAPAAVDAGGEADAGEAVREVDAGEGLPDAGDEDAGLVVSCAGPFDGERTLTHQGRTRRALVYVPASAAGRAAPLVVSLHGFSSDPEEHRDTTHYRELAEARGFIVVFPAGVGRSWNGGACCGPANALGVDDVGFVRALIAQVSAEFCVDAQRVHVSGFSNGGFMAHRLACEAADLVASVGVVAGQMAAPSCAPSRPVALPPLHRLAPREESIPT